MRTYKNQKGEEMAKEYYENNKFRSDNTSYEGFIAGYNLKTDEIRGLITMLETSKMSLGYKYDEVVNGFNKETDRKIELLEILL